MGRMHVISPLAKSISLSARSGVRHPWVGLLAIAGMMTILNALKPLHIDDPAYLAYARQIAKHPLDPFGFSMFWYAVPQPANEVLTPPVLPYYLAPAVRWFGERPWAWKCWFFPFQLLLVTGLFQLFRRFAAGALWLALVTTVFSPLLLPSINLMPDLPALALSLWALLFFIKSCDKQSLAWTVLAGGVAGLAMQTKYTGLLVPPLLVLYGWTARSAWWRGPAASGFAALVFVAWEAFVAIRYGQSHFWYHLQHSDQSLVDKVRLIVPLLSQLGGTAVGLVVLQLAAWSSSYRRFLPAADAVSTVLLLALLWPSELEAYRGTWLSLRLRFHFPQALLTSLGWLACGIGLGLLAWKLAGAATKYDDDADRKNRDHLFLLLWLLLEMAGAVVLSPFPAARRVIGLTVVLTIIIARSIAHSPGLLLARQWRLGIACVLVGLGLAYAATDWLDARAPLQVLAEAAPIKQSRPAAGCWYVGHWGLQYYAEQEGYCPVVPESSILRAGDLLLVPMESVAQQPFALDSKHIRLVKNCEVRGAWPFCMVPNGFYGGPVPIRRRGPDRYRADLYEVIRDHVARFPDEK